MEHESASQPAISGIHAASLAFKPAAKSDIVKQARNVTMVSGAVEGKK